MTTKSLLGFTALTLAALAVLVGLGLWQLKRLHWKEGLIAQIETRTKAPPITLKDATLMAGEGRDPSYYRVRVSGRFHHEQERYLLAVSAGRFGWHVITPLETSDGEMVLVDRGFVPDRLKDPSLRAEGEVEDVVTVTGIVRIPEIQGLFIPDNEPEANRWFWRDLKAMAQSMFPGGTVGARPILPRGREGRGPGRLARRRSDAGRTSQQPSAIRHHLVSLGGVPRCHLRGVCVEGAKPERRMAARGK